MHLLFLQTNTFQAIVITDSLKSYSVFTYRNDSLQWSGLDGFYNEAVVGYNMDGVFKNQPLSGTEHILNIAKKSYNNLVRKLEIWIVACNVLGSNAF